MALCYLPRAHVRLLANPQEVDADIVFIKNIDNVLPRQAKR